MDADDFLLNLDQAIEKAYREKGLIRMPPPLYPPLKSDSDFASRVAIYAELINQVENYIRGKGYETERLFCHGEGYSFMILWKNGSEDDPAIWTQSK